MENLKLIAKVFFTCLVLIQSVSSTPQRHEVSGGKIYHIETELQYNWYQAWHECARRDSQLVIIDSQAKNNEIIDLLKKVVKNKLNLWLGGSDDFIPCDVSKRSFFWSATGQKLNFTYWSGDDSTGDEEHCIHISDATPLYQWHDIDCTAKMGFICEANQYLSLSRKSKYEVVKQISSLIANELDKGHEQQISEINSKIQNIDSVTDTWLKELQKLQNTIDASVQNILHRSEDTIELRTKAVNQANSLNGGLKERQRNQDMDRSELHQHDCLLNRACPYSTYIENFIVYN